MIKMGCGKCDVIMDVYRDSHCYFEGKPVCDWCADNSVNWNEEYEILWDEVVELREQTKIVALKEIADNRRMLKEIHEELSKFVMKFYVDSSPNERLKCSKEFELFANIEDILKGVDRNG